jgi:hypothetical protein
VLWLIGYLVWLKPTWRGPRTPRARPRPFLERATQHHGKRRPYSFV